MRIDEEERFVAEGNLVDIPPDTLHGIKNPSDEALTYISAATPTADWEPFYDTGPRQART